jgi:hypothetical protein
MKAKTLFMLMLISFSTYSQNYFQNITGGYLGDDITFAASPTAYFLIHNSGTPLFIPELIKLDINGNYKWSKTLLFAGNSVNVNRILFDNNYIYISGQHTNVGYRNFLAKMDTSGNFVWTNESDYVEINTNTRIHPFNGGYLTVGHRDYLGSALDYTYDITLARLDASGSLLWGKAYGDDTYDFLANSSVVTPNGELIVAGTYGIRSTNQYIPLLARFDANGTLLWMKTLSETSGLYSSFRINDIINTSDGNFAMTGFSKDTSQNFDVQVIKINGSGNILWAQHLFQTGWQEYGKSILEDSQQNIVVSGPYTQSNNYGDFIAKLSLSGTLLGAFKIANTSDNIFYFNSAYSAIGHDLVERPGVGYALSTVYRTVNIAYRHYLVLTNYDGTFSCNTQPNTYSFSNQNMNWAPNNFTTLPAAVTNITGSLVNFNRANRNDSVLTICVPVGVNELNKEDKSITVYPNPASTYLFISMANYVTGKITLELFDALGKKVKELEVFSNGISEEHIQMDINTLTKGIYFLKVKNNSAIISKKILIQ